MKIFSLHLQSLIFALKKIIKNPVEHLINVAVISVIITLLLSILIINKSNFRWQENNVVYPQIVVYFKMDAKQTQVSELEATINHYNKKIIRGYQFIGKDQGLQELQQDNQLKSIASDLVINSSNNPIPDTLIVSTQTSSPKLLKQLSDKISNQPMVDSVDLDSNYATKVNDLLSFINRITFFLQIVFTTILVLVIYNMVRLQMLLRRDEILVSRLIGASNNFIMRPLLYYVLTQIVLGGIFAWILLHGLVNFINSLFIEFSGLFGKGFTINNLELISGIEIAVVLIIFSAFAVFIAVQQIFKNSYIR